ncbi:MAG: cobalt-precorrin 5A hydrolase [Fusobacterium sp.]|uniref:cobalt-precorrin 5A hydrolase n=1 Tax=Fusobacterium sp. TaxID=68766 RepID=UPI0026DD2CD4|nr:cobalt-precorrin 5A hydrolase [Fusobacterium sp.]MDO4691035.1 cobalt-precorrin 5A hydrolase [Fusobacterium sp.]
MKIAIWTVTRGAGNIAKEYAEILNKKLEDVIINTYTLKKFEIADTVQIDDFTSKITEKFNFYDGHIFIMASGIVIRKISNLLKSKDIDPAVLLIDEGKHFVISLLSGHLGGANELTQTVAGILNLIPIITTSSDITGKIAVDSIAQKLNAELDNLKSAKDVTSLIVDGKKVNILLPKNVKISENGNSEGIILVTNRKKVEITKICPKNIVLGIGCKKGTEAENILAAIEDVMNKYNLDIKAIKHIATVDIKENEEGLIKAVEFLDLELKIISREEIKKVENQFEGSDFVQSNVGVRAVSEPVAFLSSSQNGRFIAMKEIYSGITISIYEEDNLYI